jgi:hypothetical protein
MRLKEHSTESQHCALMTLDGIRSSSTAAAAHMKDEELFVLKTSRVCPTVACWHHATRSLATDIPAESVPNTQCSSNNTHTRFFWLVSLTFKKFLLPTSFLLALARSPRDLHAISISRHPRPGEQKRRQKTRPLIGFFFRQLRHSPARRGNIPVKKETCILWRRLEISGFLSAGSQTCFSSRVEKRETVNTCLSWWISGSSL